MKRANICSLVFVVVLVLSVCGPGIVLAQDDPSGTATQPAPAPTASTISGTLVSSNASSIVIKTETGVESTYVVDGATALPASLKPGDRVNVEYRLLDGGAYQASRVTLAADAGAPADASVTGTGTDSGAASGGSGSGSSSSAGSGSGLPQTASPLPLYGVIAVLAVGAALGLRAILKQPRPRT